MAIAEKLISISANEETIASNVQRVYEAGKAEGIAEGKQAEYDAFWDAYQSNGERTSYENAFAGSGWNDITFNPKYNMSPTSLYMTFRFSQVRDLMGICERNKVSLDFTKVTVLQYSFYYSTITRFPTIDASNAGTLIQSFAGCRQLVSVDKLILSEANKFSGTFDVLTSLVSMPIEGVIGQSGFDIHWSTKLNKASIVSIINALSTTTTGLTVTLSKTAVNTAFATAEGAANGSTSAEWLALVATRSNWTIALA